MTTPEQWWDWLWGLALLAAGWLYQRISRTDDRVDALRQRMAADELAAAHFLSRTEVEDVVDRTVAPLHADLVEIKDTQRQIFQELKEQRRGAP